MSSARPSGPPGFLGDPDASGATAPNEASASKDSVTETSIPLRAGDLAALIEADVGRDDGESAGMPPPAPSAPESETRTNVAGDGGDNLGDLLERFAQTVPYTSSSGDGVPGQKRRSSLGNQIPPPRSTNQPTGTSSSASSGGGGTMSTFSVDSAAAMLITELRRIYLAQFVRNPSNELVEALPQLLGPGAASLTSSAAAAPPAGRHSRSTSLSGKLEDPRKASAPSEIGRPRTGAPSAPTARSFVPRMTLPPVAIEPFGKPQPLKRFVGHLQRLRIMYPPELFVADWWEAVLYPVLMNSRWKELVDIIVDILHEMVVGDLADPHFPRELIEAYIAEADRAMQQLGKQDAGGRSDPIGWSIGAMNLEKIVKDAAFARPRDFFTTMNGFFVDPATRIRATRVLSKILKREEIAAYVIAETPLLDSLLSSLLVDTFPALVTMELSILVFIMPRIPTSLPALLPTIFRVLIRVVLWEQALAKELEERSSTASTREVKAGASYARKSVHRCVDMFFTHLYGMWPCSLMDFLRDYLSGNGDLKPASGTLSGGPGLRFADLLRSVLGDRGEEKLVKHIEKLPDMGHTGDGNFEAVEWPERKAILEKAFAEYLRRYTIHPSLFQMSAAQELVLNPERWSQMGDPSEIVAECLERRHRTSAFLGDDVPGEDVDSELAKSLEGLVMGDPATPKDDANASLSLATKPEAPRVRIVPPPPAESSTELFGSSSLSSLPPLTPSAVSLEDVLGQYEVLRGIADEKQVWKSSEEDVIGTDPTIPRSVILQLLLLLNELNLELYFRQIHLSWIRRLRKLGRHEEVIAAERDALVGKIHAMAAESKAIQKRLMDEREAAKTERGSYHATIAELNGTIVQLKEALADQRLKETSLHEVSKSATDTIDTLRSRLEEANGRIFELETRLSVLEPRSVQLKERDLQVTQLTKQLLMWEYDTKTGRAALQRVQELEGQLANLEHLVADKDRELADSEKTLSSDRNRADSLAIELQTAQKRLEKAEMVIKDQNSALARLRMVENEKLKMLEEKYQTVRGINLQLQVRSLWCFMVAKYLTLRFPSQTRVSNLLAQLEQSTVAVEPQLSIPRSQSDLLKDRPQSPLSATTSRPGTRAASPSAPASPAGQAIRASTQLPALPESKLPSRTPSSSSGGSGQASQLSAGLARYLPGIE